MIHFFTNSVQNSFFVVRRIRPVNANWIAGHRILILRSLQSDDCLVALLQALRPTHFAAGSLPAWQPPTPPAEPDWHKPLRLHQARVPPAWLDYNGHMNESRYLQIASEATDQLLLHLKGVRPSAPSVAKVPEKKELEDDAYYSQRDR